MDQGVSNKVDNVDEASQGLVASTTCCAGSGADKLACGANAGAACSAGAGSGSRFLPSEVFSVAPMVDVTDSIFRRMARVLSKRAMLYTEMIAAEALVHEKYHLIDFKDDELPCTLQLGGSEPHKLAHATRAGVKHGYSAINLNAGCPSDKVQSGNFGACLMKTPKVIAECFKAMQEAAGDVSVSVKTRIGVDDQDSFDFTMELMGTIYEAGCRHIIVHARKAWLNGLSPKENRTIPPLDYDRVYAIKERFPGLYVTINGGILTMDDIKRELTKVDGVMLGRAIIDNPYLLASVDREVFGDTSAPVLSREEVVYKMIELTEELVAEGKPLHMCYRHLLGLFNGQPNSKLYRRYLSENMTQKGSLPSILEHALKVMQRGSIA